MGRGTTGVQKGSVWSPNAPLPANYKSPPGAATGANIIPPSVDLMKGSTGAVSQPGGGPVLKGTGTTSNEWLQPMLNRQDDTNIKLDDLLKIEIGRAHV